RRGGQNVPRSWRRDFARPRCSWIAQFRRAGERPPEHGIATAQAERGHEQLGVAALGSRQHARGQAAAAQLERVASRVGDRERLAGFAFKEELVDPIAAGFDVAHADLEAPLAIRPLDLPAAIAAPLWTPPAEPASQPTQ